MQIKEIGVRNFRLLCDASLLLEKNVTVVVGRNNSGKTSLTEVMRRILSENSPSFRLEDFSFGVYEQFWEAFVAASDGKPEDDVRKILPAIEVRLTFSYEPGEPLGLLSNFIVDLNPDCNEALVVFGYALRSGKLGDLFAGLGDAKQEAKPDFFRALRDRIPAFYGSSFVAVDPGDETNRKVVEGSAIRALCASGFIGAQRGLDDTSHKDHVVIGRVMENLFAAARINASDVGNHTIAQELEDAVKKIQSKIDIDFNSKLDNLLPTLAMFGYPGLSDSTLRTETSLDVTRLLTNHTKVRYTGSNGIHLPEAYNGLGSRNIILILLQLLEFFKLYLALKPKPAVQLVFIEEPEVHLHPQMQEIFIRKLGEIADSFSAGQEAPWPVQFIVSTHSSHVANEAHFETIRYFHSRPDSVTSVLKTAVKDLRKGLSGKAEHDRTFLHQYMTLTRCDLFFADKAALIEGTTERLLLPRIIEKIDKAQNEGKKLGSQYISAIEIGGAYAHIFFDLVEFLELRTLVITDIDTVKPNAKNKQIACPVHDGKKTSNACIKSWFGNDEIGPTELLTAHDSAKVIGRRRLAYQIPEENGGPCGRSFEDAFMLANPKHFANSGTSNEEKELQAWHDARELKKSNFALEYLLSPEDWNIPKYIQEGLAWLAATDTPQPVVEEKPEGALA